MTLYIVDQAVVRFWDTHNPKDAQRRDGDVVVVCADCLANHLELPVTHPGVHRLQGKEIGGDIVNACKFCGDVDHALVKQFHTHAEKMFRW